MKFNLIQSTPIYHHHHLFITKGPTAHLQCYTLKSFVMVEEKRKKLRIQV